MASCRYIINFVKARAENNQMPASRLNDRITENVQPALQSYNNSISMNSCKFDGILSDFSLNYIIIRRLTRLIRLNTAETIQLDEVFHVLTNAIKQ